jgi:hypothetical protein
MRHSNRIIFYSFIGLMSVAFIAAVFFIHSLTEPVKASNISAPISSPPPKVRTIVVHGTYANFTYPSLLSPLKYKQAPSGSELAIYTYTKEDIQSWQLVITINTLHQAALSSDTGYALRLNQPSRYHATTINDGKNTFVIMTDTQATSFSKVAFALHGNMSADISLYGDDPLGDASLANTFREVLRSWQWQ